MASHIASNLQEESEFSVKLQSVDETGSLDEFDTIIIGSSIRAHRILANVRDFMARHKNDLNAKKIFFFVVCLTAKCDEGRSKAKRKYIDPVFQKYPTIKPISTEAFGGKIETDKFNPVMKNLMRHVVDQAGLAQDSSIDLTDREHVDNWTETIKQKLHKVSES
ncbi:MAG: flavodoxin domain-containing protein [candidate division KSB1 bacterium]|nr:flavodoxin domain-containing protein [candidate division KSB1 bacterium]